MLRDDDVLAILLMASSAPSSGSHVPGGGTELQFGTESLGNDAEMVAHHEAAHLELNYVTGYGLLLRAVGSDLLAEVPRCTQQQLGGLVSLCRRTHEIFATTTGVWRGPALFDGALAAYPQYAQYLTSGRALAGTLREGSFAAHTAMMCACWAAMQPPIGELLAAMPLASLTTEAIPDTFNPDRRIEVLLQADIDPATIDVALPASWREHELRNADLEVPRLHATFTAVASAYYEAFAATLDDHGFPTYAFDGHKSDPEVHQWLEANPAPLAEIIHFRPGQEGNDRFWPVTLSDGERITLRSRRELIAIHFGDLPAEGDRENVGRDTFIRGAADDSSILIVVRPLRTLLRQYDWGDETAALLRAAATDGIITALRADVGLEDGREITLLGVLSTRGQLGVLQAMSSRHGVLASVSETCSWFPNWSDYWGPALMAATHTVRMADIPRRLWLDGLEAEQAPARCRPFSIGTGPNPSGLAGLLVWFSDTYDAHDPPYLVLGSKRTAVTVASALQTIRGQGALTTSSPPEWEKTAALIGRVIESEPWVDARALEDLPDFAKIGERYQQAARIARR
jgi:hypothetical protein